MTVKQLFEVLYRPVNLLINIYDCQTNTRTTFQFKQRNDEPFVQFQDRIIQPDSVVLSSDWDMIDYLNIEVK